MHRFGSRMSPRVIKLLPKNVGYDMNKYTHGLQIQIPNQLNTNANNINAGKRSLTSYANHDNEKKDDTDNEDFYESNYSNFCYFSCGSLIWWYIVNTKTFEETFNDLINNHWINIDINIGHDHDMQLSNKTLILENLHKLDDCNNISNTSTLYTQDNYKNHVEYKFDKVNPLARIGAYCVDLGFAVVLGKLGLKFKTVQCLASVLLGMTLFGSQSLGLRLFDISMVSTKRDIYKCTINDDNVNNNMQNINCVSKGTKRYYYDYLRFLVAAAPYLTLVTWSVGMPVGYLFARVAGSSTSVGSTRNLFAGISTVPAIILYLSHWYQVMFSKNKTTWVDNLAEIQCIHTSDLINGVEPGQHMRMCTQQQ